MTTMAWAAQRRSGGGEAALQQGAGAAAESGLALMEQGVAKGGLKRASELRLHLGIAQLSAGRKDAAKQTLAALAGQGPALANTLHRPQLRAPAGDDLPTVLPAALLGRRPDIVAARWRVEAGGREVDSARGVLPQYQSAELYWLFCHWHEPALAISQPGGRTGPGAEPAAV